MSQVDISEPAPYYEMTATKLGGIGYEPPLVADQTWKGRMERACWNEVVRLYLTEKGMQGELDYTKAKGKVQSILSTAKKLLDLLEDPSPEDANEIARIHNKVKVRGMLLPRTSCEGILLKSALREFLEVAEKHTFQKEDYAERKSILSEKGKWDRELLFLLRVIYEKVSRKSAREEAKHNREPDEYHGEFVVFVRSVCLALKVSIPDHSRAHENTIFEGGQWEPETKYVWRLWLDYLR